MTMTRTALREIAHLSAEARRGLGLPTGRHKQGYRRPEQRPSNTPPSPGWARMQNWIHHPDMQGLWVMLARTLPTELRVRPYRLKVGYLAVLALHQAALKSDAPRRAQDASRYDESVTISWLDLARSLMLPHQRRAAKILRALHTIGLIMADDCSSPYHGGSPQHRVRIRRTTSGKHDLPLGVDDAQKLLAHVRETRKLPDAFWWPTPFD